MKNLKQIDIAWLSVLGVLAFGFCILTRSSVFLSSILISGVLCVVLIAIGRKEGYLVGLYSSCAYAFVAYQNGLFGEVALNVLFFIPTGILGYFMWKKNMSGGVVSMRRLTGKARTGILALCLISVLLVGWVLAKIPTQNTPYIDASTNVLSIVATFLMMWRYKEQWALYMLLNVISVIMWVLRWMAEGMAGDLMILMWSMYLANSIFGYWRWSKGIKANMVLSETVC